MGSGSLLEAPLLPKVRPCEIDEFIAAAGHDGLEHIKRKALRHLSRDARRNRKHHPADEGVNQYRSVMGECIGNAALNITWIFKPDPAHANGFRHSREIWVFERGAGVEKPRRLLLYLHKSKRAIVEHDDFDRQIVLHKREEVA